MKGKNNLPQKLSKLAQKRIEKKFDLLPELDQKIEKHLIKRSKNTNLFKVKKKLDEIGDSFYIKFQFESRFNKIDNNIQEMKGSLNNMNNKLDNMNNTLGEMKYSIDSLFLINAMKESFYQLDDKNSIDNLISNRCNQILKELMENDKKNKNKNEIDFKNENNIINEKNIKIEESQKQNVGSNNCDNKNEKSLHGTKSNVSINQKNKNKNRISFTKKTGKSKPKDNISKDNLSGKLSSSKEDSININDDIIIKKNNTKYISGRKGNKEEIKINFKKMKKTRKKDMIQENIFLRNPINYHKKAIKKFSPKIPTRINTEL